MLKDDCHIGDLVEADSTYEGDFDCGAVLGFDETGLNAWVAWATGVKTWCPIADLRPAPHRNGLSR
jgi:hypothetical protein